MVLPFLKKVYLNVIVVVLWLIEAASTSYRIFLPSLLKDLFAALDSISAPAQGILRFVPLLLLGVVIQKQKESNVKLNFVGFSISFILLCGEVYLLKHFAAEGFSYIIFTLLAVYFLFRLVHNFDSKIRLENTAFLANISTTIYCVHPAIILLLNDVFKIDVNMWKFVLTAIISTAIGFGVFVINKKMRVQK